MSFWFKKRKPNPLDRLSETNIVAIDKMFKVAKHIGDSPARLMREAGISEEKIALAEKIYADHIEPMRKQGIDPALYFESNEKNSKGLRMPEKTTPVKSDRKKINEGMRRLGIVIGFIFALAWVIFTAILTDGFEEIHGLGLILFFLGIPFFFAIGRLLIWSINWVISGFLEGYSDSNKSTS